jgi:hypothetical protein
MRMHKLNIDGKEILFLNTFRDSSSGFIHEAELYINEWPAAAARCHYINRTWERYTYQSVMLEAVHKLQEEETEREKRAFKHLHGIHNIMTRHKPALAEYLERSEKLSFYKKIEEALR